MVKGERRKKREEIRRIVAEDDKRRKEKAMRKSSPRKANYRKDKDGNVILFGNIKISKTSWIVLGIIGAIGLYLGIGGNEMFEMEGYEEIKFSFAECEATDFKADMCNYYYKFCHTYADGKSICQYAEEDPWTKYDNTETKWTEEEQDFLPPSQFILPFVYGERGEDEPVCYSTACKNAHPDLVGAVKKVDTNLTIQNAKKIIKELEHEINILEKKIRQYEIDKDQWDFDVKVADNEYEEGEAEYETAKTAYRHAFDIDVKTQEDIDIQKQASIDYKQAKINWKKIQSDWKKTQQQRDNNYELYYTAKKDLKILEDELKLAYEEFDLAKINNRIAQRGDNQFINIILSDTCITMIENNFKTNCPTYRELRDSLDNTLPNVSGEWVDTEFDVSREPSKYKKYWNYYKQLPNWKIITVDPDVSIRNYGVNITIHPDSFTYLEKHDSVLKNESIDLDSHELYVWKNIQYDEYCGNVAIAPDMILLQDAINNIWDSCKTNVQPDISKYETSDFPRTSSPWYMYSEWLKTAIIECKEKC